MLGAQGLQSERNALEVERMQKKLSEEKEVFFSSLLLSSLELSDTKVYEPYIQALLGTAARFCQAVGGARG